MTRLSEIGGRRVPFLRWSFVRMVLGMKRLTTEWQVGDGREEALGEHVVSTAAPGDLGGAIDAVDQFCYRESFMMNVGDEKGELLDAAIGRANPGRLLELGTYCGYSALRTARAMPEGAHLFSIEFNEANAAVARRILAHAGVDDRVTIVVGTLGDGGQTIAALEGEHGFAENSLDFVFIDHAKDAYLPDLQRILEQRWLRPGARAVADNVKFPGAPDYRDFMRAEEGKGWRTTGHETHVEYQSVIKDLVLESEYLG
ncbi:MAG TPA: O-methyltransferase [Thermoleophilaceae bacterium]|nr:O-methyltransferase [Thermoleophilaceae bacterium]